MGFGHGDERSFDGVMRMAFLPGPGLRTPSPVDAEQFGDRLSCECNQDEGDDQVPQLIARKRADGI